MKSLNCQLPKCQHKHPNIVFLISTNKTPDQIKPLKTNTNITYIYGQVQLK